MVPILDVGIVDALRQGRVGVVAAVERFEAVTVVLADGARVTPDVVIAATGYRRGLEPLVGHLGVVGADGRPTVHGGQSAPGLPGLHFIGFTNPISGALRGFGAEAAQIARVLRPRTRSAAR